jgi:tyrosyl-tRNA synthetase
MSPTADALLTLRARGFVEQISDEAALAAHLAAGALVFYAGFDPTAASLHVGSYIPLMAMAHLGRAGHQPIAVLGGGTAMVGDPSGKTEMRQLITPETIAANRRGIEPQVRRIIGDSAKIVDNGDWLLPLNYIQFLRDIGRHFSVNRMLAAEAYKMRLEKGLSFIEFNYQLLQAYDFLALNERFNCVLQIGGDDQWGNILAGVDLIRRVRQQEAYGLTFPLLTTAAGAKMGKTAAGAVWLNEEQLSAYDYWQFWRNADDADVEKLLKIYTRLPLPEIARLAALEGAEINEAKKVLATEATALLHGRDKAEAAAKTAQQTFEQGTLAEGLPTVEIPAAELSAGLGVLSAFVKAGLVKSNGEARRQIAGGGLRVNDVGVTDESAKLTPQDVSGGVIKLSLGRKRHVLLRPV